jgi:CHAT domain-containing protein
MVLKGKAAIIDALSKEKEAAYCIYDDNIELMTNQYNEICSDISEMIFARRRISDLDAFDGQLRSLYHYKDSIEQEISSRCFEFKQDLIAKKFELNDIAETLPDTGILLEFIKYRPFDFYRIGNFTQRTAAPRYLVIILDNFGGIELKDLGKAQIIDSLISDYRMALLDAPRYIYRHKIEEAEEILAAITTQLYGVLFAPVEELCAGKHQIYISADGQLNLLPFEILTGPDGRYIVEKYQISYLSSGRDLVTFNKIHEQSDWALAIANPDYDYYRDMMASSNEENSKDFSYFAYTFEPSRDASGCLNGIFDPLPYTEQETRSIVEILQSNADLSVNSFYKEDAQEEVLKGITSPPLVLHLSTHGFFCEDADDISENPLLRSGLALAGANNIIENPENRSEQTEDGILTALEVSGLNLIGTELVVLSACKTGVGDIKNGEGVYGLRRAFQQAGARSIVMSMWSVPDKQTIEIMQGFYENWLSGYSKAEALRKSELDVISERRKAHESTHPFFWGGFILLGDPN